MRGPTASPEDLGIFLLASDRSNTEHEQGTLSAEFSLLEVSRLLARYGCFLLEEEPA